MTNNLTKSEQAFEAWYLKQKEAPMPSDCWEAAIQWVRGELIKLVVEFDLGSNSYKTSPEQVVHLYDIEELTK